MGWNQFMCRASRTARTERDEMRRHRAADDEYQRLERTDRVDSAAQLQRYDSYVALLVTLHADCGEAWDWRHVELASPPSEPMHRHDGEEAARAALEAYRPGLVARLTGGGERKRAALEDRVGHAMYLDRKHYESALSQHRAAYKRWSTAVRLAPSVLALELDACSEALRFVGAFDEIAAFKTRVTLDSVGDGIATFSCVIQDPDVVPVEELALTASGNLLAKDMSKIKFWALYRDHVCSCAIRIAREAFAALPIAGALVNVMAERLDPARGAMFPDPILGVHFTRDAMDELDVPALGATDCIGNFPYWMKFKRRAGHDRTDQPTA